MPIPTLQSDNEVGLRDRSNRLVRRRQGLRRRARSSTTSTSTPNRGRNRPNRRPDRGGGGVFGRGRRGIANALRRLVN